MQARFKPSKIDSRNLTGNFSPIAPVLSARDATTLFAKFSVAPPGDRSKSLKSTKQVDIVKKKKATTFVPEWEEELFGLVYRAAGINTALDFRT
jgi:hypothetical protein